MTFCTFLLIWMLTVGFISLANTLTIYWIPYSSKLWSGCYVIATEKPHSKTTYPSLPLDCSLQLY